GGWLTVDPYGQYFSPYMGMDNNPVSSIDPDGGCTDCSECPDACGQLNMENIPAGQSIDMNLDGYFLRNDLQSSLGEAANLGIIQDGPGISMQLFPTFPAMSEQSGWDH